MKSFGLLVLSNAALAADIYVSPSGSDSGDASITSPLLSIQSAVNLASPGDTIYLRAGTFSPATNIQIKKSGTESSPYTIKAYENEQVIIDGEALTGTPAEVGGSLATADRGILHVQGANYWKFYGIELINGPYGVYQQDSSNNYYERISTHDNYETGFQIQGNSSNNQVVYLDSYLNRDPRKNGESADGFGCKEGQGEGNVLLGARLYNNVDDGLDFWQVKGNMFCVTKSNSWCREFKSAVTVKDTIAWGNGFNRWDFTDFAGDGNGFKLGGGNEGDVGPADHIITNCIAFGNAAKGFTDNSQEGDFSLNRNTAWNNGDVGFKLASSVSQIEDSIAACNGGTTTSSSQITLQGSQTATGNSWQDGTTWTNASFVSVDTSLVAQDRQSDGKIPASDFLLPESGEEIGATTHW